MTARRSRGTFAAVLVTALTAVAGAVAAAACHAVSVSFGLFLGLVVLMEGVGVAAAGAYLTRRGQRQSQRHEMARRAALPPLPREWDVPDFPPPDLTS